MNRTPAYDGDHLVICDYSGFTCKRSDCRKTWDGKIVRKDFWEPRHPQDIIRPRRDDQSIKDARPKKPDPPLLDPPISLSDTI
jgi:hypothetical protein